MKKRGESEDEIELGGVPMNLRELESPLTALYIY